MTALSKPALYTPTSAKGVSALSVSNQKKPSDPRQDFMMAAANMSWQLAIVVLVPILVGYKLDRHFGTLPLWTGIGFFVAMIGMVLVVYRQLQLFSPKITQADIDNAKKIRDAEDAKNQEDDR